MYAIKLNQDNKIIAKQRLSDKYIAKYKDDPSNPLNQGYISVEDTKDYEWATTVVETEKERVMETLGITQANLDKLKTLSVSL